MIQTDSKVVRNAPAGVLAYLRPGEIHLSTLPPLSLYIHFPWCVRKCPYCDFNSHQFKESFPESAYLDALRSDLENALPLIWGRKIMTVFIGGGTPSLISAAGIDRLMSDLRARLPLDVCAEVTLEANPGAFEADKFKSYRDSGINRLSIGIQSFDRALLQALGRIHDEREARRAVEIAQAAFENFNLDLMYALPSQDMGQVRRDVETAIRCGAPHLSFYHLTLEPNTFFAKRPPSLPDDDLSAEMQDLIQQRLAAGGYLHYEVSAYAKPGLEARHNLNYWRFGDYLGIGAGAHSKISFPHRVLRQARFSQPNAYFDALRTGSAVEHEHEVALADLGFEFMLNALRLTQGLEGSLFAERCGLSLSALEPALAAAEAKGLLVRDHRIIQPTALGQRFLNDLQQMFLD